MYECPKKNNSANHNSLIYLHKNNGHVNSLGYLYTCIAGRDLGTLEKIHLKNFKHKQESLDNYVAPSLEYRIKETKPISCIKLIIEKKLPSSADKG